MIKRSRPVKVCRNCKQKKIKCNKLSPCNHCSKHGKRCEYDSTVDYADKLILLGEKLSRYSEPEGHKILDKLMQQLDHDYGNLGYDGKDGIISANTTMETLISLDPILCKIMHRNINNLPENFDQENVDQENFDSIFYKRWLEDTTSTPRLGKLSKVNASDEELTQLNQRIIRLLPEKSVIDDKLARFFNELYCSIPILDEVQYQQSIQRILATNLTTVNDEDLCNLGILLIILKLFSPFPGIDTVIMAQDILSAFNFDDHQSLEILQLSVFIRFYLVYGSEYGSTTQAISQFTQRLFDKCRSRLDTTIGKKIWTYLYEFEIIQFSLIGRTMDISPNPMEVGVPVLHDEYGTDETLTNKLLLSIPKVYHILQPLNNLYQSVMKIDQLETVLDKVNVSFAGLDFGIWDLMQLKYRLMVNIITLSTYCKILFYKKRRGSKCGEYFQRLMNLIYGNNGIMIMLNNMFKTHVPFTLTPLVINLIERILYTNISIIIQFKSSSDDDCKLFVNLLNLFQIKLLDYVKRFTWRYDAWKLQQFMNNLFSLTIDYYLNLEEKREFLPQWNRVLINCRETCGDEMVFKPHLLQLEPIDKLI